MTGKPVQVLLVEDDPGDVDLTREALNQAKVKINLTVVGDGVKAMAYLHKKGQYEKAIQPDLILLDLNLPKKDGREVLSEIKDNKNLKHIPVLVLTTSDADEDVISTYKLGCNCYITKPVGLRQFTKVVRSIEDFWFTIARLPTR